MPSYPASTSSCCSQTCPDPVVLNIPGPQGLSGLDGGDGTNGVNGFSFTSAQFVMPAELDSVTISVTDTQWMAVGQVVYIPGAGYMTVDTISSPVEVILVNPMDTGSGAYLTNAAPGTAIANGTIITPAGIQGPSPGGGVGVAIIGIGSPEGAQIANPGQSYLDNTIPASPSLWYKMSGVGNVGWKQLIA